MREAQGHVHSASCSHGASETESQHPVQDLSVVIYGGELPECKTPEERAAVIEALPTAAVGDLIGKVRELWRLGRVLFEQKSYSPSLHLFSEAIRLGSRWLMISENVNYWSEVYNTFHALPIGVDELELAVFMSWSQWMMITTCLSALKSQANELPREVLSQRLGDIRKLQSFYEQKMRSASVIKVAAARLPQQAVVWLGLSVYYSSIRNEKEDLACARAAVQCDPTNFEAQIRLGISLLEAKLPDEVGPCFAAALSVLPEGAPERMTAHLGAAFCELGKNSAAAIDHVRELRKLDLQYSAAAGLRFAAVARELIPLVWLDVLKTLEATLAKGGVCNWCLKQGADKQCSACAASEYCSMDCFKLAWKGDSFFPPHKAKCAKK